AERDRVAGGARSFGCRDGGRAEPAEPDRDSAEPDESGADGPATGAAGATAVAAAVAAGGPAEWGGPEFSRQPGEREGDRGGAAAEPRRCDPARVEEQPRADSAELQ